jgi:hypothetical protein
MGFITYSNTTPCSCDSCGGEPGYGFFVSGKPLSLMDDPDDEIFLCSGCAQRSVSLTHLQREVDISLPAEEPDAVDPLVIESWLNYEELGA